jgi:hypothetical protein
MDTEYWSGEMHHVDEIGFDSEKNLRLYLPRGEKGVWTIDPEYIPENEDYLMNRNIRLRRIEEPR